MLKGTGVCAGVGLGTALVVQTQELDWSGVQYAGAEQEKARLAAAAKTVSDTLAAMAQAMTSQVGEHAAEILSGQIMMLADPFMIGQMNEQIEGGAVAEAAVDAVCGSFIAMFSAVEDELTRQRATDVADLRDRLLKTLLGHVYMDPDERTVKDYEARREAFEARRAVLKEYLGKPTVTADGRSVALYANIGRPEDAAPALEKGAEGIGLFRTEFLFMDRDAAPTEEEQLAAYRQVAAQFAGGEVIIRTLDVGGDKDVPYLGMDKEENPFLGHRAIRYCLDNPELYMTQLRALLRAGAEKHNVRIMLPLITGVEELRAAKALLEKAKAELAAEGKPFDADIKVGVMIETPAAALVADLLAQEADFFSIGTNDLTQYTLAVDRGNAKVAKLYTVFHPAVLRSIKSVIAAAKAAGIPVGMCGEAAADPALLPLLLAWGLDEFSVSASSILATKRSISLWSAADAAFAEKEAMKLSAAESILGCLGSMKKE